MAKKKRKTGEKYRLLVKMDREDELTLTHKANLLGVNKTQLIITAIRALNMTTIKAYIDKRFTDLKTMIDKFVKMDHTENFPLKGLVRVGCKAKKAPVPHVKKRS